MAFASGGLYQSPVPLTPGNTNLPTELIAFEVRETEEGAANLKWVTASEVNSDYVNIEETTDGINWEVLGRVNAAGNSQVILNYTYTDVTPKFSSEGVSYYRLKMVDLDGSFEYSPLRSLSRTGNSEFNLSIYPNPANQQINVDLSQVDWSQGEVELRVYNSQGICVHAQTFRDFFTGEMSLEQFSSSIYFFQFTQGEETIYHTKVIKEG